MSDQNSTEQPVAPLFRLEPTDKLRELRSGRIVLEWRDITELWQVWSAQTTTKEKRTLPAFVEFLDACPRFHEDSTH